MKLETIVVATDLSDYSASALRAGVRVAEKYGADVRALHVLEPPYPQEVVHYGIDVDLTLSEQELRVARQEVQRWLDRHAPKSGRPAVPAVRAGYVSEAIEEEAEQSGARLIVIGTHGRGFFSRAVIGSVAESLVRTARTPVLSVHEDFRGDLRRILVPIDVAHSELQGLPPGESLAEDFGAEIHYLYAFPDPQRFPVVTWKHFPGVDEAEFYEQATRRARAHLQERVEQCVSIGARHRFAAVMGRPARAIAAYAHDHEIDLIVMSTHGRTGLARAILGSVAENVVRVAPCPVWTQHRVG